MLSSYSGANHSVLHVQNDRIGLGPIETCNSGPKGAVLHAKTTDDGWDPHRLEILMLGTLFCMHKTSGEVWEPQRLVILLLTKLCCMYITSMRSGTHGD